MLKRILTAGMFLAIAVLCTTAVYAADGGSSGSAWTDFWNGVGGFLYNALPWNWGNWAGK